MLIEKELDFYCCTCQNVEKIFLNKKEPGTIQKFKSVTVWKLTGGLFHENNINSYFNLNTFVIYIACVGPTAKNLEGISIFLGYLV